MDGTGKFVFPSSFVFVGRPLAPPDFLPDNSVIASLEKVRNFKGKRELFEIPLQNSKTRKTSKTTPEHSLTFWEAQTRFNQLKS